MSAPSGGPRDKTPPVVVKSIPVNGVRNFTGKKLIITFNEFVVLEKINDKFMVSPPMSKKPRILIKGKSLDVEFIDKLKDSTTYTLNFLDAIRDLNEGNILDNFQFVFSTGKVIDSLSVAGKVFTALNLDVPENTLVLLYRNLADSAVKKQLPDYISRVDKNGAFRINNIRGGKYRLYALKDIDNSKNYNLREEEFGFLDNPVEITPEKNYFPVLKDTIKIEPEGKATRDSLFKSRGKEIKVKPDGKVIPDSIFKSTENTIILFAAQKTNHYLTSSDRKLAYQLIYTLSLPPDSSTFEFSIPGTGNAAYFIEKTRNNDTITVWLTDSSLYSQPLIKTIIRFPFTDTTGILVNKEDTIQMRYLAPRKPRGVIKRTPLQIKYSISSGVLKPGQQILFTSQTPFRKPDTSRIKLFETVKETKIKVPYTLVRDTSNSSRYKMSAKLISGKKYLFIADSASLGNIYGEYCDSTGIKFSVAEASAYGTLVFNIKKVPCPLIIQILDKAEKLIGEKYIKADGKVEFPLLEKGVYRFRAIFDLNGDGKWTTGDFDKRRQPEPVSYYPSEIETRADWSVENDWIIGVKNFKDQKFREIKK